MSIQLLQQDGLYYNSADTFTVDTNPCLHSSPFMGSAFTVPPPDIYLIDDNNDDKDDNSTCSDVPDTHQPPQPQTKLMTNSHPHDVNCHTHAN